MLRVVHSVRSWLPLGGDWIYNQVVGTLDETEPYVVCDMTLNLDRFPVDHLYAISDRRLLSLIDRTLFRASIRRPRSLLAAVVKASAADILHSHFGQMGWENSRFAQRAAIPHIVSCYGWDMTEVAVSSSRWRTRYAEMFASIDRMLCEGPYMAGTVEKLGCPREKIQVHPLGADIARIPYRPRAGRSGKPVRILMAATFREKKGLSYAAQALGLLARRGVSFEGTIVGDARRDDDPREKREILGALERFGIRDRIRLPGLIPHDDLIDLAYSHDIFLSPSVTAVSGDAEGGAPVALIEMAASGMPVVSTRHCDIPFVLGEPNRHLLVAERDAEGLANAIERLVGMDWEPMVRANRTRIEELQDARKQARGLVGIYRELTA